MKKRSKRDRDIAFITEDLYNVSLNLYSVGKKYTEEKWWWGPVLSDLYTLHYIRSGSAVYRVGENTFDMHPGDALLIYPNTISFIETDGSPYRCYWLNFSGNNVPDLLKNTDFLPESPVITVKDDLSPLIERTLAGKGLLPYQQSFMVGNLYLILSLIMKSSCRCLRKKSQQKEYIYAATQYISQKYSDQITVEQVAKKVGVSTSHLHRIFRQELCTSPNEFITKIRMKKSVCLMGEEDLTIKMIAGYVGIKDPLYFSKLFSAWFGIPPTEYRKLILKSKGEEENENF